MSPWLLSLLFNVVFFGVTCGFLLVMLPLLLVPRHVMQSVVRLWARLLMVLLHRLLGITWQVQGLENLVDGPAIFAVKHQSMWDTAVFYLLLRDPVYVLKRELLSIPLWGWYARHAGTIAVDRSGGAAALRSLVKGARQALERGSSVIIFPEGTRVAPGDRRPYQPGIAALGRIGSYPIIPVALNSGLFWGRRRFVKRPGRITLEVLPALPAGLDRKALLEQLEQRIETACERLTQTPP